MKRALVTALLMVGLAGPAHAGTQVHVRVTEGMTLTDHGVITNSPFGYTVQLTSLGYIASPKV